MEALVIYLLLPSLFVGFICCMWMVVDNFIIRRIRQTVEEGRFD